MKTKPRTLGLIISAATHMVVVAVALIYVVTSNDGPAVKRTGQAGGAAAGMEQPAPDVARILAEQDQQTAAMSDAAKMDKLAGKVKSLEKVPMKNVDAIAAAVERHRGVDTHRLYRPDSSATGRFEPASACLYDIKKTLAGAGVVYRYTMVDRAGRTLKYEVAARDMTPNDLMTAKLFEMTSNNPKLRRLLEAAIKIGDKQISQSPESAPASGGQPARRAAP